MRSSYCLTQLHMSGQFSGRAYYELVRQRTVQLRRIAAQNVFSVWNARISTTTPFPFNLSQLLRLYLRNRAARHPNFYYKIKCWSDINSFKQVRYCLANRQDKSTHWAKITYGSLLVINEQCRLSFTSTCIYANFFCENSQNPFQHTLNNYTICESIVYIYSYFTWRLPWT